MKTEEPLVGTTANLRVMFASAWITPSDAILQHEIILSSERQDIDLKAYWFVASRSMLPALRAVLKPAIDFAQARDKASREGHVFENYVDDEIQDESDPFLLPVDGHVDTLDAGTAVAEPLNQLAFVL